MDQVVIFVVILQWELELECMTFIFAFAQCHGCNMGSIGLYGFENEVYYCLSGICQVMEAFLNLLIIICAGVSHSTKGEYRDIASLGGVYEYHYGGANAFTGAEAEQVKRLDRQFYQLKLPPYIFSMACGGALMVYALAMLALGIFRVPYRWPLTLLVEAILNALIGLGYIPAVAFYFIKLQEVYNHPICKQREQMYNSKGLRGFECSFHGADIAGGLFGVMGVILFPMGAVLAIRAFRAVRERKKQRELESNHL